MALSKEQQRRGDIHRIRKSLSKAFYDACGTTTQEIDARVARINFLQAEINELDGEIRQAEQMHHRRLETKARQVGFSHVEKVALMRFDMGQMLSLTSAIEMFDQAVADSTRLLGAGLEDECLEDEAEAA